jgi:hypothetical protein
VEYAWLNEKVLSQFVIASPSNNEGFGGGTAQTHCVGRVLIDCKDRACPSMNPPSMQYDREALQRSVKRGD